MSTQEQRYTDTRIKMIQMMKDRVKNTKPVIDPVTKHKIQKLFLIDYVVYACLRGSDFRKADHTGGEQAIKDLNQFIDRFEYFYGYQKDLANHLRYHKDELIQILKESLII